MLADVAHAGCAEQRVDQGVREDVGVGVAVEAAVVLDLDTPDHEPPARGEAVAVVADAGERGHSLAPIGSRRRSRPSNTHSSPTPSSERSSSAWS